MSHISTDNLYGNCAFVEIMLERDRQKSIEGWTEAHDDEHTDNSLAFAAAVYANPSPRLDNETGFPEDWPSSWSPHWYKRKDRRRDLVRAAALIIAEIERMDRAASRPPNTAISRQQIDEQLSGGGKDGGE